MRLYHGTGHDVTDGMIRPGADVGHDNHGSIGKEEGQESRKNAFASGSEEAAWEYAWNDRDSRARVYEVRPSPYARKGALHDHEYVAPTFAIKHRIDIMPGRQGTIPVNWNQFAPRGDRFDTNHPNNYEVAHGNGKREHTPRLGDHPPQDSPNWSGKHSAQDEKIPGLD